MRIPFFATATYIVFIVFLNMLLVNSAPIHFFSYPISPGDVFVGFIYLVRDFAQREIKHYVFLAMLTGAIISFFLASHAVAIASVSAFVAGEIIDWSVYTFTKRPLSSRLIYSAVLSSPIDTIIFLGLIHQLTLPSFLVMTTGKILGVVLLWTLWKVKAAAWQPLANVISSR